MIFYFYKITNNINGKYYYGVHSTNNINDGYMGSGIAINKAYEKYDKSNFTKTIMRYFVGNEDMYAYEKQIVNKDLVKDPMCYNISLGGKGGNPLAGKTDEEISEIGNKKSRATKGKPKSKEHKERISKALKGKSPSQEQRQRISNTLKGNTPWNKNKRGIYTDIQVEKISNAMQDRIWIHNGVESKFIKSSELSKYQENGYKLGRLKYKNKIIK